MNQYAILRRSGWKSGGDLELAAERSRQVGALSVLADLLRTRRLVDADGPDRAVALVEHITADPADVLGHLVVSDLARAGGGHLQVAA